MCTYWKNSKKFLLFEMEHFTILISDYCSEEPLIYWSEIRYFDHVLRNYGTVDWRNGGIS